MTGIKPVSLPGPFATRLDPRSISPRAGTPVHGKLPAPRGELIQEQGPVTALSARRVTAGATGTGGATGTAGTGGAGASTRAAAPEVDRAGQARLAQEVAPPLARSEVSESAAQRRSANAQVLSAVLSDPAMPASAGLGILLRLADQMAPQDAALLSTGSGALARRLAAEPDSQRKAYLAIVATAHQQGRIGDTAFGTLMTQLSA